MLDGSSKNKIKHNNLKKKKMTAGFDYKNIKKFLSHTIKNEL